MNMVASKTDHDKREHRRYAGVYASYALTNTYGQGGEESDFKTSFLRDFSIGGMSLFVSEHVPERSYINVRIFDSRWSKPIEAFGGIVWQEHIPIGKKGNRERYNVGVRFLNMPQEAERRLKLMIMNFEVEQKKEYSITELIHHHNHAH